MAGPRVAGRVTVVGAAVTPGVGTYEVELQLDAPVRLQDGGAVASGCRGRDDHARAAPAVKLVPIEALLEGIPTARTSGRSARTAPPVRRDVRVAFSTRPRGDRERPRRRERIVTAARPICPKVARGAEREMRVPELAVKFPQLTIVLFLMAAALGVTALGSIPLAEGPDVPGLDVRRRRGLSGATPADLEQLVVDKLETHFNELDDLKSLKTSIEDGVAVITVEFESNTDPDRSTTRSCAR